MRFKHLSGLACTAVLAVASGCALAAPGLPDITIDDTAVFPESVTSSADGTVYAGSIKGNVYRAMPGSAHATKFIATTPQNGILAILGVFADDASNTLWLCSVPNFFGKDRSQGVSALMAFDLKTGTQKGSYPFPPPASACNDIALAADGTPYVTDTSNGRIFRLTSEERGLDLVGQDPLLVGIDGLAFSGDGTLYVNNVRSNKLYRVTLTPEGTMAGLTPIAIKEQLGGPDGFRSIGGNRFLQAEGTAGRLSVLTIDNDTATMKVLKDDLVSSPGTTLVGDTAYVLESNIGYLTDPKLRGKEPGPFVIYAVPVDK